jgi:NAD(P)-dependent dehydrogenase (short-subunit alcohol dehydrogenase family)
MIGPTKLQGKLALVTGVTSGIGAAAVRALLQQEALVIGVARDSARLEQATREFGPGFRPLLCDLAESPQRQRCLRSWPARAQSIS